MCFSAEADFASGALIGVIGLATLTKVEQPREVPLAALPLAFALHQVAEGFVWLDLDGGHAPVSGIAVYLYALFAWVALPVLAPISIMLLEPHGPVRRRIGVLVMVGAIAGSYLSIAVWSGHVSAHAVQHTIQYGGGGRFWIAASVLYVVATCGAPLLSGFRAIVWFGVANLVAVATIATVQAEGFTSLWCLLAAVVSALIYLQFVWWRRDDQRGTPTVPMRSMPVGSSQLPRS